ncbi:AMP-binding protein, partial [Streptomyces sp. NPDC005708]
MILSELRPGQDLIREYRETGVWRTEGPLADLRKWRNETPEATAVIAHRAGTGMRRLTYRELSDYVERFARALTELDVGPGQVVAM